jgi:DNA polymerase III subunit delta
MGTMVFFFYGTNTYMLRQKLREMTSTYLEKTGTDMGLERIDGANVTIDRLRSSLQASPFLTTSRLIIVESLGKNKVVSAKIDHLIELVPETTVAVFVETEIDQRTVYFKELSKSAKVVQFEALPLPKLGNWIQGQVENLGGTIDRSAVNLLLEMTNGDQWRLSEEIQKLVNYKSTVTRETIMLLVEAGLDQNVFDMVEAMSAGRADEALKTYRKLINAREDPFKILGMVEWQLRNLLLAKAGGQISQPELAKVGGMSPYVAGKMQTAARRHDLDTLKAAFAGAVDTEYFMKTGQVPAEVGLEQLIYRVASVTQSRIA